MCVESGEWGPQAGVRGRGRSCWAEGLLNELFPASRPVRPPSPCTGHISSLFHAGPCALLCSHVLLLKPFLTERLPFLGPDTWSPLRKEQLTSLSLQNHIVYIMKEKSSSV